MPEMREVIEEYRRKRVHAADEVGQALDQMPYGMYIIGSRDGGEVNGMLADWVMQVSFNPRLIAVSIENDARTLMNIRASSVFSVNLLAADGMALAAKFAQPYYGSKIRGRAEPAVSEIHHKLEGVSYHTGETGCPILSEALAWFECRVETLLPLGDHTLVVGRILSGAVARDAEPLTSNITGWPYSG